MSKCHRENKTIFLKNVLYITYDGLTDPLGQSQILPYLRYLTKKGYSFTILSFEKHARFKKEEEVVQAITDALNIRWVPLFFTTKPPVLSKVFDRYRMERTAQNLHRKYHFDLLHCRSYVAAEVGLGLKEKFGIKMLFDMRGFWADEKVDNGQWDLSKLLFRSIYRHYKKKERAFLLQADGIISLTESAKRHLLKQPEYSDLTIDVIPCCADLDHFNHKRLDKTKVQARKGAIGIPSAAKVMAYLGSVGGWYMTKEMFVFFAELQQRDPEYVLLLLTKDNPAQVIEEARLAGIPSSKLFITYASREDLPYYLGFCTSSIFFIRNTFSKIASSPTKHAELMGMGIPVICNDIGDTGHIIKTTGTGLLVNEFGSESMTSALASLPVLETLEKETIRSHAIALFDLAKGGAHYYDVYRRII